VERVAGEEVAARIVSLLPSAQAEVVLLRVVAGLGVADVARLLGRSPASVRVLQHRALRRLARHLGEDPGALTGLVRNDQAGNDPHALQRQPGLERSRE
jgi:DNA-directed RNA polymerase specialized sigma24 family protein